jgi:hypothetical protein
MTRTQMTRIRRLARAFAVALAALAVAAPAAQAMPAPRSVDTQTTPRTTLHTFYLDQYLATHRDLVAGSAATPTPVATPVAVPAPVSTGNGFDWADAAIGAAVAAGTLALLGLAGIGVRARGFAH